MCVIITSTSSAQRPTLRQLELCEVANSHGSGIAWADGKRVRYAKNWSVEKIHAHLAAVAGPAIIHFRIASVGGVKADLCHPFPITHAAELQQHGSARRVIFHNGTWSDWRRYADHFSITYPRKEPVSDTRVAASIVARFGFDWLERADYCRWAMLDADGIHRIGQWVKVGPCHYSNNYWLPRQGDFFNVTY